ncbi:hypothetical protein K6W26_23070 [Burkholderia sp. AU42008]|uniref:hypothetical protein n=1 Tax=unclassified Burkholderia TaxID=2613784 RepID=UPI0011783BDA|nr:MULTISPECIES: hypothetical protein [unclassified Burkholderia]MBR8234618.1 hypothetical protein [Burkholderia sp. AU32357]MBY4875939.1 hypothetical protein [Burkholderia sp. AU42008]
MRKRTPRPGDWTPADDALFEQLWRAGEPLKKMADHFPGRSAHALSMHRCRLGLPCRGGPKAVAADHPVMQKIWKELKRRRATRMQLAERAGVALSTVVKFVQLYEGRIHVCGWTTGGARSEILKAGPGENVPKPAPKTRKERCADWWEKARRERPDYAGHRVARDRVLRLEREGKLVRRDVAAIALFGAANVGAPSDG